MDDGMLAPPYYQIDPVIIESWRHLLRVEDDFVRLTRVSIGSEPTLGENDLPEDKPQSVLEIMDDLCSSIAEVHKWFFEGPKTDEALHSTTWTLRALAYSASLLIKRLSLDRVAGCAALLAAADAEENGHMQCAVKAFEEDQEQKRDLEAKKERLFTENPLFRGQGL